MRHKIQEAPLGLLYSPQPPEAYSCLCGEVGRVGIGMELAAPELRPIWNLYWLSDPAVDRLLTGGAGPLLDTDMLPACYEAVNQGLDGNPLAVLLRNLPPTEFVEAVRAGNYKRLAPYRLRKEQWLTTIQERAALFRGELKRSSNVIHVNFARKQPQIKETAG